VNLIADESVDGPIVESLRLDGHQVTYIAELDPGVNDDEVFRRTNEVSEAVLPGAEAQRQRPNEGFHHALNGTQSRPRSSTIFTMSE
jgi:hypothetical protein